MTGRVLRTQKTMGSVSVNYSLENLSNSIYYLQIISEEGIVVTRKVIKELK